MDSCHSSENNSSDGDLSEASNAINETFSNDENEEKLMPTSEKTKWALSEDAIEAMELHFEILGMKDLASFSGMKNMAELDQHRAFKERYPQEAKDKIQRMRKIWAEQLGIGEHLTQKQWYWAMGLDDIPEPPTWPKEAWLEESQPQVRPFWYKNDLGASLDAWAKWNPLLFNELNSLRDSNASKYWKRHDSMLQYSGNPRNIQ